MQEIGVKNAKTLCWCLRSCWSLPSHGFSHSVGGFYKIPPNSERVCSGICRVRENFIVNYMCDDANRLLRGHIAFRDKLATTSVRWPVTCPVSIYRFVAGRRYLSLRSSPLSLRPSKVRICGWLTINRALRHNYRQIVCPYQNLFISLQRQDSGAKDWAVRLS